MLHFQIDNQPALIPATVPELLSQVDEEWQYHDDEAQHAIVVDRRREYLGHTAAQGQLLIDLPGRLQELMSWGVAVEPAILEQTKDWAKESIYGMDKLGTAEHGIGAFLISRLNSRHDEIDNGVSAIEYLVRLSLRKTAAVAMLNQPETVEAAA